MQRPGWKKAVGESYCTNLEAAGKQFFKMVEDNDFGGATANVDQDRTLVDEGECL